MTKTPASRPGRPPDLEIEPKVIAAVLEVYAKVGWGGFTIDAVARHSRVGKAAIYRRWSSKQGLIAAAIASLRPPSATPFNGPFRDDLLHVAERLSTRYLGKHGLAYLRALVEAKMFPEVLGEALEPFRRDMIAAGRRIVVGAIERGELPKDTSPALLMDTMAGAMMYHVLMMPNDQIVKLAADPSEFNEQVVAFTLAGAGWMPPTSGGQPEVE
ncbi:TetR/AcrR family transcriptional regulator [Streptomyces sp. NPDC050145]|uniref:TetR/AcrR family transcriptional regulator n=1 Tax=Streptomyces sp. NPDC050145 TaxID=3365602 RepID=UPI003796B5A0